MNRLICILISCLVATACGRTHVLKSARVLEHYPSASGIEYLHGKYFVIGDDATGLLILDSNLAPTDSISLYPASPSRIPKQTKPDLESAALTNDRLPQLLLLGSGSLAPYRNTGWVLDLTSGRQDSIRLDTFYRRLLLPGIKEINIEGSSAIPGGFVMATRGHRDYPKNYLLFTGPSFWKKQSTVPVSALLVGPPSDSTLFRGVSGIAYAAKSDRLILTVSTEDTRSSYEDGTIGKSYVWIIKGISAKQRWKSVNPDQVIDLEKTDGRFRGQKIESVCVVNETRHFLDLVLVADNDSGISTVFNLLVEKN